MACIMGMLLSSGGQGHGHSPANGRHLNDSRQAIIRAIDGTISTFFRGTSKDG
jgi:hypothetical protein